MGEGGERVRIKESEMHPTVLRCGYFTGYFQNVPSDGLSLTPRICYDYEIEYYIRSDGGVFINDKFVRFSAGDVSVRKPGEKVLGIQPYECYVLCLDLKGERCLPEEYLFGDVLHAQPYYENDCIQNLPSRLRFSHGDKLVTLFQEMIQASQEKAAGSRLQINGLAQYMLSLVMQETEKQRKSIKKSNAHILKAEQYIRNHFTEEIEIAALIRDLGLSKAYFNREFKAYCGQTPGEMILALRMEKAKMLLSITEMPVSEIASVCGFSGAAYFSGKFRQLYAMTPKEYRRQNSVRSDRIPAKREKNAPLSYRLG